MTTPPKPLPQRTRRSARTRERILEAATETFARRGFHGSRVADIAEQAGIAYGLVYHHFKNKDDILAAIFAERWGQYVNYLYDVSAMQLSFAERIGKLVHFWVETYRQEPYLMTVMINEISRSYEFIESHDVEAIMAAFDPVEKIIAAGKASGEVRDSVDTQLAAYAVVGIAEMVLTGYVMGRLQRDREGFLEDERQLAAFLVNGLSASH